MRAWCTASCQQHVSNTLAIRQQQISNKLATHSQHVSNTLATNQQHVGNTLATHQQHTSNTPATHQHHISTTLAPHQHHISNTLATHWASSQKVNQFLFKRIIFSPYLRRLRNQNQHKLRLWTKECEKTVFRNIRIRKFEYSFEYGFEHSVFRNVRIWKDCFSQFDHVTSQLFPNSNGKNDRKYLKSYLPS